MGALSQDAQREADDLREILAALEMPPAGLRRWFSDLGEFCERHGGQRRYAGLLALLHECRRALGEE